jgi:hypothetical protein
MGLWDKFKDWKGKRDNDRTLAKMENENRKNGFGDVESKPARPSRPTFFRESPFTEKARNFGNRVGEKLGKAKENLLGGVASVFKGAKEGWGRFKEERQHRIDKMDKRHDRALRGENPRGKRKDTGGGWDL